MNLKCSLLHQDKGHKKIYKKTQYSAIESALATINFSGITKDIVALFLFSHFVIYLFILI